MEVWGGGAPLLHRVEEGGEGRRWRKGERQSTQLLKHSLSSSSSSSSSAAAAAFHPDYSPSCCVCGKAARGGRVVGSEGVGHCATVFATAPPYPTPLPPLVSLVADHKSDQLVSMVQFHTAGLLPGRLIERARVSQVLSLSVSLSLCCITPAEFLSNHQ